jgi:hypothetical protein
VVRLDGVDDLGRLLQPPCQLGADQRVRAFDLVRHGLPDVVHERASFDELHLLGRQPQLGRHRGRDVRALDEVLEHILTV